MVLGRPSDIEVTCGLYWGKISGSPYIRRSGISRKNREISTSVIFVVDDQPLRSSRDRPGACGMEYAEVFFGRHHRV